MHQPFFPLHYTYGLRSRRVCIIAELRVCCFYEKQVAYDAYRHRRRASRYPAFAPQPSPRIPVQVSRLTDSSQSFSTVLRPIFQLMPR